jgi:chromosome segregation ATPase
MDKTGLLSRIGTWFRRLRRSGKGVGTAPDLVESPPVRPTRAEHAEDDPSVEAVGTAVVRRSRRDYSLSRLQEGYDRVLEMMDAMHKHMQVQEDRTEQIASGMSQLSRSLADLPGVSQQQVQLLSGIAAQLETSTVRTQQLADAVGELPRVVRGQTEALKAVGHELEMASESDAHLATSLQSFERAVGHLGESAEHQAAAMRDLRTAHDDQQKRLGEIIEQQTRRFTIMLIIVAVLAGAGIVVSTVALVLRFVR